MSTELIVFNDILFRHRSPWKNQLSEQKFRQLTNDLKREAYKYQPLYQVAFQKPVSQKRQYYHALILNEAINFLNSIYHEIQTALNDQEKNYWVTSSLQKKIKPKFDEVKKLIDKRDYRLSNITLTNDDAYIVQFLKYQLIRLYLEIQNTYSDYTKDTLLQEEDIHLNFFSDAASTTNLIITAPKENLPVSESIPLAKPIKEKFEAYNHEIRPEQDGVLVYDEIVAKPESLGRIESILFEVHLIKKDFQFIENQGNIKKLAAVAQVMYQNNFFKKNGFLKKKNIKVTDLQVRRFLNYRYGTDIGQEFRRFNQKEAFQEYLNTNLWIRNLPTY